MEASSTERQVAVIVKVDTHIRKTDLEVAYNNDPDIVENFINMLEQLLGEDDKYKLVDVNLEYTSGRAGHDHMVGGGENKKQKDSMVDLATIIIHPYYRDMKAEGEKDKSVWHKAWLNKMDEGHIKYAAKDAYTSYEMYTRIADMRKCLLPIDSEG
ncbi:putative ubiquitin-conjugating enzyme E2 26 [Hordeum vulgare]|nr:putative ubiquitin-conjugating enzyme E2 26 [Hordeum vulgare]